MPTAADEALVNNGGHAIADSASAFYPGAGTLAQAGDLNIGYRTLTGVAPPGATGMVTMTDVGLEVGGGASGILRVGVVETSGIGLSNSATGILTTTGGANNPGTVTVVSDALFGVVIDGEQAGLANGTGTIAGNLSNSASGDLLIGTTADVAGADGSVEVTGDVTGFESITVGATLLDSTGNATGTLDVQGAVHSNAPATGSFVVGTVAGAGTTEGHADIDNGLFGFNVVALGAGSADQDATGTTDASLDVFAGGVHSQGSGFSFEVATTNGPSSTVAAADVSGGISGYGIVAVGLARETFSPAGNATGTLVVTDSGIVGTGTGGSLNFFDIGTTVGPGNADGSVEVTGDVTGFESITVGATGVGSTGNGIGSLSVADGQVTATSLQVGIGGGTGTAFGSVSLDRVLVSLDTSLTLENALIELFVDGFARGSEYSAFDTVTALIDGDMQVVFDFAPAPGSYVFDLIVTESLDGIMGTFDSFNVFNLDPMFKVTHGVEIAGGVDVYRLRIGTTLSEPSSLALLAASLALLGIVRRRKCGARSPARYA